MDDDDAAPSDSIEHNIAGLEDDDEVDEINLAIINKEKNDSVDELPNYVPCDWEESGLCILIRQQPTKKCQHPGGGCANYVHHLCMIQWAFANNIPEDESIGAVCREHCSDYVRIGCREGQPIGVNTPITPTVIKPVPTLPVTAGDVPVTSNVTIPAVIPTIPGWTALTWVCHKCNDEQSLKRRRCGNCKAWKGGTRSMKKTIPAPQVNTEPMKTPSVKNKGRIKKKSRGDGIRAVLEVAVDVGMQDVSPYMSPRQLGDIATAADDMSMSLNSSSTLNDSLGFNPLQDDDDNTVTRARHDARVLRLQEEDDNYEGDGGTSDGEGEGYDVVQGFRDDMI